MQHAVVSDWFKIVLSCSIFKYELDSKEGPSCYSFYSCQKIICQNWVGGWVVNLNLDNVFKYTLFYFGGYPLVGNLYAPPSPQQLLGFVD